MSFSIFQVVLSILLLGIQLFLYRNFTRYTRQKENIRRILIPITTLFVAFNIPLIIWPVSRVLRLNIASWVPIYLMPPVYLWHFVSLVLFTLLAAGKILKIPFLTLGWLLGRFERTRSLLDAFRSDSRVRKFDMRRRQAVRQTLTVITGSLALGSAYQIYRKDTFETTVTHIPVKNLPPSFDGFSIGFISDIHSGIFMDEERMRSYAEAVNSLGADMIVVTGDFVNSSLDEVYPFRDAFSILSAEHGVFGVLGNHDFFTRRVDDVVREVEKGGISVLRNRSLTLRKNDDRLHLAGVDDTGNDRTASGYFDSVAAGHADPGVRILLCHRPYFFPQAASRGFDLILAGHTHGGQVVLGEFGKDVLAPARLVSPYVAGLYREGSAKMYVSRGIGTVGVPFRFNCPPEITKIILERETAS
jgi:predicted MPP superfamily phosphohydrolase